MNPGHMTRIVDGKKYDTAKATLIAHNAYWDGHNYERRGRNLFLYKTPNGRFFTVSQSLWQGESDTLEPILSADAVHLYETSLPEHEVPYEEAFPDFPVEDA